MPQIINFYYFVPAFFDCNNKPFESINRIGFDEISLFY
jgi:hypothetical protein